MFWNSIKRSVLSSRNNLTNLIYYIVIFKASVDASTILLKLHKYWAVRKIISFFWRKIKHEFFNYIFLILVQYILPSFEQDIDSTLIKCLIFSYFKSYWSFSINWNILENWQYNKVNGGNLSKIFWRRSHFRLYRKWISTFLF